MTFRFLRKSITFVVITLLFDLSFASFSAAQTSSDARREQVRRRSDENGPRRRGGEDRDAGDRDSRSAGGRFGDGAGRGGRTGGMDFSRMGGGFDPALGLLQSPAVQEELELIEEQKQAVRKLGDESRRGGEGREAGQRDETPRFDFSNATDDERKAFFAKMQTQQKERSEKTRSQLEEVLMPDQLERLDELSLQRRGLMALADAEIQKELGITAEQVQKLQEARSSQESTMRDRIRELMQSGDRENIREKMTELRAGIEQQVMDVLTPSQKKKLEEMKGKPFDFGDTDDRRGRRGE